ncbi:MAG: DUF2950 domain-containing protein [Piscinibacter sp.]|nr:DUF2950 domain-containing protein [Piscinibacter sp.]
MNIPRNPIAGPRLLQRSAIVLALAVVATAAYLPAAAQTAAASTASTPKPASRSQPTFESPQAGFEAIVAALRAADAKQLARILGPGHQRIVDSGDTAADRADWARFVASYDAKHSVRLDGDAKAVLLIGADDWPMAIPLVKRDAGWAFDAPAGEEELLARRIGRNELDTIQVCLAFVDMQREYAELDRDGDGLLEYTAKIVSSAGKRDGLYWPTKAGEAESPAGPRLAAADPKAKGRTSGSPYHGYYYRVLTAQGKHAPGGARNYLANGQLIGGVALVAYPATYLNSGVKTFMCNLDGVVYEKDLGTGTASAVAKMKAYDPDPTWTQVK